MADAAAHCAAAWSLRVVPGGLTLPRLVPLPVHLTCLQVVPGELTIVTGVPNSGKSEWIDALLANLAEQHDWCFALCSMEKKVGGWGQWWWWW